MCGIYGVRGFHGDKEAKRLYWKLVKGLAKRSMSRGRDSSGLAVVERQVVQIFKDASGASYFIEDQAVKRAIEDADSLHLLSFGHSRMETNGSYLQQHNNQPVEYNGAITIHNGILVNVDDLWDQETKLERRYEVDTEIISARVSDSCEHLPLAASVRRGLQDIEGSFSIACFSNRHDQLALATNTGSLYFYADSSELEPSSLFAFGSELMILQDALAEAGVESAANIHQMQAGQMLILELKCGTWHREQIKKSVATVSGTARFEVTRTVQPKRLVRPRPQMRPIADNAKNMAKIERVVNEGYENALGVVNRLKRCSKCILPETMPFITFDKDGICNYCHRHQPRETRGVEALHADLTKYLQDKSKNPWADCIVSFSGGRDSSYALHYVVKELGLKPIAYSYDWGMLTSLGRRNQARMTAKLGVEHVLVSADIQTKRKYIRQNVSAWIKQPHLGTVPLFMAGDKQYFYHLNQLQKRTGIDLIIYADNALEKTDFKYGFANINLDPEVGKAHHIGRFNAFKLLAFYGSQYLANPSYLNSSLKDTFGAYLSQYFTPKDYLYLFRYILWEEQEVESTLVEQYNWELAEDTKSSWRIGDGTQAFYNYIYYVGAGLTENDTFRSNQIREGAISRDEGLRLAAVGNQPRLNSLIWYFDTIGLDAEAVLRRVNQMPKVYDVK